ncbi:MAG TPA: hypothetical protein VH914_18870 [Acidimicrobiia bacterium]|nr:hypothetical protein [Acidimicrobiia bacterium]
MTALALPDGWDRDEVNRMLRYHGEIAHGLTVQRTALESALIPVTAYILVSGVECYRRHPELMTAIAAATTPESLGARGRELGNQIDTVHLWSIANIYLVGRSVLAGGGLIDFDADISRTAVVLDFWKRAAAEFRADGTLQAADAAGVVTPYTDHVDEIVAGCLPVRDDEHRARLSRLNALLTSYLFLLYFDTRAGYQDTGPYLLPDGRVLLLRAFNRFGVSDFAWSHDIAAELPYSTVLAAFVLDGVDFHVTDFGTSVTDPSDYLDRLVAFGLFDPTSGRAVPIIESDALALGESVKAAQRKLYRLIADMDRRDKINAGAYVYFTFLRPFAEAAGVADQLDWSMPRDSLDLYPLLELFESTPEIEQDAAVYYPPIP